MPGYSGRKLREAVIKVAAAVLLYVGALSACASGETMGEKTGVNSALGIPPATQDFVAKAVVADLFQIKAGKLAERRTAYQTQDFAATMVRDHMDTSGELVYLAHRARIDVPTQLDDTHQKMFDKLENLDGQAFTVAYRASQESCLKRAMTLFRRYGRSGDHAELRAWASRTLPRLQRHLKMLQQADVL